MRMLPLAQRTSLNNDKGYQLAMVGLLPGVHVKYCHWLARVCRGSCDRDCGTRKPRCFQGMIEVRSQKSPSPETRE